MEWVEPAFVEIDLNAEVGGYQSDFGGGEPAEPSNPLCLPSTARAPSDIDGAES